MGKLNRSMFSSLTPEHSTPTGLFNELNSEFHFTLDVCATHENHKVDKYYTKKDNAFLQDWSKDTCWMNPPYGSDCYFWCKKAWLTSQAGGLVVALLASRTDNTWWHEFVMKSNDIRFIRGRLRFGNASDDAPFPSVVVVWQP